ncbi:hypothetical protein AALB_1330 [Agarivorans albus MKT 106]|uniref:Manganese-dependent inorganic pyrophosphatase n=1 Tax=Agarivorans albus MKT 106 TaxID=1331007 RepID=R9PIS2_AGAAL|nr:hypothetical protein AALB_1330 [Agarivorans albus MKT 106]
MLVLGHTNPDCDSIAGAISLAELLTKQGTQQQRLLKVNLILKPNFS